MTTKSTRWRGNYALNEYIKADRRVKATYLLLRGERGSTPTTEKASQRVQRIPTGLRGESILCRRSSLRGRGPSKQRPGSRTDEEGTRIAGGG